MDEAGKVRVDKWLWAARFYKTRGLAQDAIDAGHVRLNGERPKPSRTLKPGDKLELRLNQLEYHLEVRALSERRGPATVARALYHEDADSIARREARQLQLKAEHATFPHGEGRPTKKTRRQLSQFKDGLG